MMRKQLWCSAAVGFLAAALLAGCGQDTDTTAPAVNKTEKTNPVSVTQVKEPEAVSAEDFESRSQVRENNPVSAEFVGAAQAFSYDSAARLLAEGTKNRNYSPLSLYYALALAAQGAEGKTEEEMLAVLGMSTVIGMAGKNIVKNILAMALGLIFSCIGMSPQTGLARFTFGQVSLMDGISLIPMLIGLFGITAILEMIEAIQKNPAVKDFKEEVKENYKKVKVILPDKEMSKRLLPIWAQSSLIGNIIGIIPGAGMIMAIFMAYDQAARRRPNLEFGTGVPEGIAAPESANNAVVASSMVPLLSLGVPGNSTSSLFLGALTIQGLRTGPSLFRDTPEMAYMIILGFIVANIIMLPLCMFYCNFLATAVLRLKREILSGIVLVLCVTGAFAVSNNIFNIYIMIFFGFIGYTFNKYKIPQSPLILASILGSMMENNWTQSMVFADGSLSVFVTRPLSCALLILSIIFIGMPLVKRFKAARKTA